MKTLNEYIPDLDWIHKSKPTLQKAKIYLKPQEKPPKGLEVKRGPKGGLYYESKVQITKPGRIYLKPGKMPPTSFRGPVSLDPKIDTYYYEPGKRKKIIPKKISPKKIAPKPASSLETINTKIITDSIFKIDKKDRVPLLQKRKEILDLIVNRFKFEDPVRASSNAKIILEIWEECGYDDEDLAPLWEAAVKESGKTGVPKEVQIKIDSPRTGYFYQNYYRTAVPIFQELIKFTKKLMVQKFGDTPITLYRGISAQHTDLRAELAKKESLEMEPRALESWTNSKETAKFYAKDDGFVIKTTIHPADVGLLGSICIPNMCVAWNANEFCLNKKDSLVVSLEK